jgi:hypothetical protein
MTTEHADVENVHIEGILRAAELRKRIGACADL